MKMEVCVGGFLMKKNKFLFAKRSSKKTWAAKAWDIVGGRLIKGECPLSALKRETFEETGVKVLNAHLLKSVDVLDEKAKKYFRYHIYMITAWKGKPANCSDEHTEIRWLTRKKLGKVNIASKIYLKLLDDWLNGNKIAE